MQGFIKRVFVNMEKAIYIYMQGFIKRVFVNMEKYVNKFAFYKPLHTDQKWQPQFKGET